MELSGDVTSALLTNLSAAVADPELWRSIFAMLVLGSLLAVAGAATARRVGLIAYDGPDSEALGVGLATGLLVVTSVLAAVASGGRSAFTPIAVAFGVALALSLRRGTEPDPVPRRWSMPFRSITIVGAVALASSLALLFASTIAPSARGGVQPVEFMDEAFYSILGRDIVRTGVEAFYSPSGFGAPPGFPDQTWYHWGELWLAGGVAEAFGIGASAARHMVVLPLLLLASTTIIGCFARRAIGSRSSRVLVFGAAAGLLLAPIPIADPANYFASWASGTLFSVTMYGLAIVEVPLLMLLIGGGRGVPASTPTRMAFVAALAAMLLPSHVAMALLAAGGAVAALAISIVQIRLETGRLPRPSRHALGLTASIVGLVMTTYIWGTLTGHRVVGSGLSPLITPFNEVWRGAVVATLAGAVTFLTIPAVSLLVRRQSPALAGILVAVCAIVVAGALAWGARIAEFTMFHVYFGAIAVFGTPAAAASIVIVWDRLRRSGRSALAVVIMAVAVVQVEIGLVSSGIRLAQFSARDYPPIPIAVLDAIRSLDPGAKIAYACRQQEEIAYWDARLLSIDLHTGRRIVPLCYEADLLAPIIGAGGETNAMSPQYPYAPQFELYPTADAKPTPDQVLTFMRGAGIGYIFVDAVHPNSLVPSAIPILTSGDTQLLRLP